MNNDNGVPPYRLTPGDQVMVENLDGIFKVASVDDASLVTLELPNGNTLRVGWRSLRWPGGGHAA